MSPRSRVLGCCLTAALMALPVQAAAQCLLDVEKTIDLMQEPGGDKKKPKGAEKDGHFGVKGGTQSGTISESWQGGSQAQDATAGNRPAYNAEAAKYLGIAADLARANKEGGCVQLLVQAQRILALIPADTPLPRTTTQ